MKVLRILALVFGILLLLGGGGLLLAAYGAERGNNFVSTQMDQAGLKGPVTATVTGVDEPSEGYVTVEYTDDTGVDREAVSPSGTAGRALRVGERVPVYYDAQNPETVLIAELPADALSGLASGLRSWGWGLLITGGSLILLSILMSVLGRKAPAVAPVASASQGYPPYGAPGPPQYGRPSPQPPYGQPGQQPPYGQQTSYGQGGRSDNAPQSSPWDQPPASSPWGQPPGR